MAKMVPITDQARRSYNITAENKKGKIPKKLSMLTFMLTLIGATVARYFQLKTNMNWETGQYIDNSLLKNYPLLIIIGGMFITLLLLVFGSAKDKVINKCILLNPMRLRYDRLNPKISSTAAYGCILMALLTAVEIIFDFAELVADNKEIRDTITNTLEWKEYSLLTGYSIADGLKHALMFVCMLTFICIAANIFKKIGFTAANCAALSAVSLWKVLDVIVMVRDNTMIGAFSEDTYEFLTACGAGVFFMLVARLFNGMEQKHTRIILCFEGYLTAVLAAVSTLPRYALLLDPNGYSERVNMSMPPAGDIGVMIICTSIVCVFWSTYVYRSMPKLARKDQKRWNKSIVPDKYQEMETIDFES